jgi:hypothetical protein
VLAFASRSLLIPIACACVFLGSSVFCRAEDDRLILLDGQTVSGVIGAIDAQGAIRGEGLPEKIELDGLRRIERAAVTPRATASAIVLEVAGGKLYATSVTIASERCQIAWEFGEKLSLPIDVVKAVRFDPQTRHDAFEEALKTPSTENDRLFVRVEDKVQMVSGLVEELAADKVVFQFQGKQQTLPREKLFGIVTAQIGGAASTAGHSLIELRDGSSFSGIPQTLAEGILELKVAGSGKVSVPWASVARISVRSTRLAYLSELDPTEVVEQSLVTTPRPYRRDRSVGGRTLTLGQRSFEKGLGTHALCKLTFAADGKFDTFAATLGIDAETEGRGDCIFSVLADGKEIFAKRFKGADPAHDLKLDVRGAKLLTLLVEPGEDLDLADHANWCDARLIRSTKTSGK